MKKIRDKFIKSNWLEWIEKIFFSLFIFSIPFQIRLTFPTPETFHNGRFNEYATFFIYISDIFILITFIAYFVNVLPRILASYQTCNLSSTINKLFVIGQNSENTQPDNILTKKDIISIITHTLSTSPQLIPIIILLLLVLLSFVSTEWASNPSIALFKSFKLFELVLLFIYIDYRFRRFGVLRFFGLVFVSGILQSVIGLIQYYFQHSLGLRFLGESLINPYTDNVAKIIIENERVIRAYGTFPHPNVFGAFLILSIFSGIWLLLSFRSSERDIIVSRETIIRSTNERVVTASRPNVNKLNFKSYSNILFKLFHVKQFSKYVYTLSLVFITIGIVIQMYALLFTYSRLAWIGFIMTFFLIIFLNYNKLFHVKQFIMGKPQKALIVVMLLFIIITGTYWNTIVNRVADSNQTYEQSINDRVLYKEIALKIIDSNRYFGVGNGNYTLVMAKYTEKSLEWWQYQPVHNIYLLITSELGATGLIIFILFIISMFRKFFIHDKDSQIVSRETILIRSISASLLITFLIMGLYDHYFWSFQQGQLMFWSMIGIVAAMNNSDN